MITPGRLSMAAMRYLAIMLVGCTAGVPDPMPAKPTAATVEGEARFRYAGEITDQRGHPVVGATVTATHRHADGSLGYIDVIRTDRKGRFAIDRARALSNASAAILDGAMLRLEFEHPDCLYSRLEDAKLLPADHLANLYIQLRDGQTCRGRVLDQAGQPVSGAMVQAVFAGGYEFRKAALTDPDGNFRLRGLPLADASIQVVKMDRKSALSAQVSTTMGSADSPLLITAKTFTWPAGKVVHRLFGMELLDLDKDLQNALFLSASEGVLILNAGRNPQRLGVGQLRPGDSFWLVGDKPVRGFEDFARQLLAHCEGSGSSSKNQRVVRVVYRFRRLDSQGTSTQYMRLTEDDLLELRRITQVPSEAH